MYIVTANILFIGKQILFYRDLKLENLVLESNDIQSNIKVIDFGTCKIFKHKEIMKDITGSVIFLYFRLIILRLKYFIKNTLKSVICGVLE